MRVAEAVAQELIQMVAPLGAPVLHRQAERVALIPAVALEIMVVEGAVPLEMGPLIWEVWVFHRP